MTFIFDVLAPIASGAAVELAPSVSTIAQKFLADCQKKEIPAPAHDDSLFAPLKITLSPTIQISPLPQWEKDSVHIDQESASVEIPIPALAEETEIENLAITINFYDMGDGGPLLEGIKHDGERFLICSGLGINGPALGLNSRTIAIPADLALDGGKIIVSHTGRFEQLHSIILRPGRTAMISVLSENLMPSIADGSSIIEQDAASGAVPIFKKGDSIHDGITTAELSAPIEQLSGSLEFSFDEATPPDAAIFRTQIQGLDLDAHIDVVLNGTLVGPLNISSFQLDAPELISTPKNNSSSDSETPVFQYAGWREAYLYIPNNFWKNKKTDQPETNSEKNSEEKKNHLLLIVKPGADVGGSKIHLKNSCLELLH